jgi:hypothetical protein
MSAENTAFPLNQNFQSFTKVIDALSDEQFLTVMDGWSPRDVVAHLIGWNGLMIDSALEILAGNPPSYYQDAPNDYSNINAEFMNKYSSRSKREMLADLQSTMKKLESFIESLSAGEFTASHGVTHHSGGPASVARIVSSLAGDYEYHIRQVEGWFPKK